MDTENIVVLGSKSGLPPAWKPDSSPTPAPGAGFGAGAGVNVVFK